METSQATTHQGYPLKALTAAILLASTSVAGLAHSAQQENLSTLVVTASGFEQDVTQAPASISVVTREDLERRQVTSLADALAGIEGVDVRPLDARDGKTGNQSIQLRGLPREYTLVLIDGVRQNPAATVAPNSFGDSASVFIPPVAAIERIEIIRGPMSTLYGSDALGGVVNIITRQPSEDWSGSLSVDNRFHTDERFGGESTAEGYIAGSLIDNTLNVQAYGRFFERAESRVQIPGIDYYDDARLYDTRSMGQNPTGANADTVGIRFTYTPLVDQTFSLSYDRARQTYNNDRGQLGTLYRNTNDGPCDPEQLNNFCQGYSDELGFERDQVTLHHEGHFQLGTWASSITHDRIATTGRTIRADQFDDASQNGSPRKLEVETLIVNSKFALPLGDHLVTVGGQYLDPEFTDGMMPSSISSSRYSLFVEDEWSVLPTLTLTGGVRYEDDDTVGSEVTPRLYAVWNTTDEVTLKGGVSQGFRTPFLEQTHDGVIGFGDGGSTELFGNPDLSAEKSTNAEVSIVYDNYQDLLLQATYFFTRLEDKIESGTGANTGTLNIGEAEIQGVELSARYRFMEDFTLRANYTYLDSEVTKTQLDTGEDDQRIASKKGDPLVSTPDHLLNVALDWQATESLLAYAGAEYRSDAFRPRNFHEPQNGGGAQGRTSDDRRDSNAVLGDFKGYTLVHLGARYQVNEMLSVNGRIDNLLDKDFVDYKEYTTWGNDTAYSNRYNSILPGRNLWLSVNVDF